MTYIKLFETFEEDLPPDNTPDKEKYSVVFVGGCDDRRDKGGRLIDKPLTEQVKLLGLNLPVKSFRYSNYSGPKEALKQNPKSIVILFSAGCKQANDLSLLMKHKNRMFIVEPYALSKNTRDSVGDAVKVGVPEKNVIVKKLDKGQYGGRGFGIVPNPTFTPDGFGHWGALTYIGSFVNQTFRN